MVKSEVTVSGDKIVVQGGTVANLTVGADVPTLPVVKVVDAEGAPVAGARVTLGAAASSQAYP